MNTITGTLAINPWNHRLLRLMEKFFSALFPPVIFMATLLLAVVSLKEMVLAPAVFSFIFLAAGLLVCRLVFKADRGKAIRLFLQVFCFSLLFTLIFYLVVLHKYGGPYMGESDSYRANQAAEEVLELEGLGSREAFLYYILQGNSHGNWYYIGFVTLLYRISHAMGINHHNLVPRLVNSLMLALLALVAWRFAALAGCGDRVSLLCGYMSGLWPISVFRSAFIRRDAIFAFFLLAAVFLFIRFLKNEKRVNLVSLGLFFFSVVVVSSLRLGFLAILSGLFVLIAGLYFYGGINNKNLLSRIMAGMIAVLLLSAVLAVNVRNNYIGDKLLILNEVVEHYTDRRGGFGAENPGIGVSIFRLPMYISLPMRLLYANIDPAPIPSSFLILNYRWLGTLFWFMCLPVLYKTVFHGLFLPADKFFALKSTVITFLVLFILINGITFEEAHQPMYIPFGLMLIFFGLERQNVSYIRYFPFLGAFAALALALYLPAKLL